MLLSGAGWSAGGFTQLLHISVRSLLPWCSFSAGSCRSPRERCSAVNLPAFVVLTSWVSPGSAHHTHHCSIQGSLFSSLFTGRVGCGWWSSGLSGLEWSESSSQSNLPLPLVLNCCKLFPLSKAHKPISGSISIQQNI